MPLLTIAVSRSSFTPPFFPFLGGGVMERRCYSVRYSYTVLVLSAWFFLCFSICFDIIVSSLPGMLFFFSRF